MAIRPDEHAAALMLKGMLDKLGVHSEWKPGDDPPDLVFEVENLGCWAVEVTGLHQYFAKAAGSESRRAVTEPLIKTCERIQAQVSSQVNSDYLIEGFGPVERPSLREIEKRAVAYILGRKSDEQKLDDDGRVRIRRVTSPVRVGWMVGLHHSTLGPRGTLAADIRANITFALERILEAKLPRLASLKTCDRRLLLITKNYLFAEPEMIREILGTHGLSREQLDTVLLATETGVHWVCDPGRLFN